MKTRMKVGIRIMRSQFFDFEEDGTCWHEVENVSVVNLVESVEADEEFHERFDVEQHFSNSIPEHVDLGVNGHSRWN